MNNIPGRACGRVIEGEEESEGKEGMMSRSICEMETVMIGGPNSRPVSKVERYGWILRDSPGQLMHIDKAELMIDHQYQRDDISPHKVQALASAWSWAGCGVISVALRPNGLYFVFDGQHRVLAARKRSDIRELPCIVFECDSVAKEAAGFLVANSERKPISAIDKFRSLVITEDEAARHVEETIERLGLEICKSAAKPGQIKCISRCLAMVSSDSESFDIALKTCRDLCDGISHINDDLLKGLFTIQRKHGLLEDRRFIARLKQVGHGLVMEGIRRARAYRMNGGERTVMEGIFQAVNKGLRSKFGGDDMQDDE